MNKIFGQHSKTLIKNQKAKAKLSEFNTNKKDYPNFVGDSDDLIYSSQYALYKYCKIIYHYDSYIAKDDLIESFKYLEAVIREIEKDNTISVKKDLILLASIASFLYEDFASSKVLARNLNLDENDSELCRTIIKVLKYAHGQVELFKPKSGIFIDELISDYLNRKISIDDFKITYKNFENNYICDYNNFLSFYFLYSLILSFEINRADKLLPNFSNSTVEMWEEYFKGRQAVKLLWQSQKLICESGFLKGQSGVISLPTGVGKTKSIEIIAESGFINGRVNNVLIVAPLKTLCNEITRDLTQQFGREIVNGSISDANIDDYSGLLNTDEKRIIIMTPEKLDYIIHHDHLFTNNFQLMIFDEAHLLSNSHRGLKFELMLSYIKRHANESQQVVLMTAVITNIEDIGKWFFGESFSLVDNKDLYTSNKTIGFYRPDLNKLDFFDDEVSTIDFEYYIPKAITPFDINNKKKFPNNFNKNEVAVYFASVLSKQDSTIIFVPQVKQIKALLKATKWTEETRHLDEQEKIDNFILENYGEDSELYIGALKGFYVHHGRVQNGVRILLEDAYKKRIITKLISTSTLAQGVNLPIKNFIIKGTIQEKGIMSDEDFKNLYGRAARPDKYINGNVILLDYVNKNINSRKKWSIKTRYIKYTSKNTPVLCNSALDLLGIVDDENVNNNSTHELLASLETNAYVDTDDSNKLEKIFNHLSLNTNYALLMGDIENHIAIEMEERNESNFVNKVLECCKSTYCFYKTANENEKDILKLLFLLVGNHYLHLTNRKKELLFITTCNDHDLEIILNYVDALSGFEINKVKDDLIELFFKNKSLFNTIISFEDYKRLLESWIGGASIASILIINKNNPILSDLIQLEKILKTDFEYGIPYFISNAIEAMNGLDTELKIINGMIVDEKYELISELNNYLERVKYGLPNSLSIDVYKNIFQDRLISLKFCAHLNDQVVDYDDVKERLHDKEFLDALSEDLSIYPSFFINKMIDAANKDK